METLLELTSGLERPTVSAKAMRLSREAGHWAAYQRLGARLVDTVSTTVATIAPWLAHEKLALLVRYSLWTCLVDERLDGSDMSQSELDRIAWSVSAVLRGDRVPTPGDVMETELAVVLAGFREYDRGSGMLTSIVDAVGDGLMAALEHAELSRQVALGSADPPTAEEYLDVASRHIRYRSFALGLLQVAGAAPTREAMEVVEQALSSASRAVRLVNDLRTAAKDEREGSLNILALHTSGRVRLGVQEIECQVERHVQTHDELLESASDLGLSELFVSALTNSVRVAVGMYRITDLMQEEPWPFPPIP